MAAVPDHSLFKADVTEASYIEVKPLQFEPAPMLADYDVLSGSATLADGSPLPEWLEFDPDTFRFKFKPSSSI